MLFNSLEFLIFFPTVVLLYFLLPYRFRWVLLLVASYVFYMFWRAEYALLLLLSTLIDYGCGLGMNRYPDEEKQKRKPWLYLSLFSNLSLLFTFKYYNFFNTAAHDLAQLLGLSYAAPAFALLLPMGISFYTFQTMSYSIDVYYGRIKAEKHLGIFALFVTFFPQLVAGPIERAENLLSQLREKHSFDYGRIVSGLQLMAWGLFKKVLIADRLALMVNQVYNNPTDYAGIPLLLATFFFAFQIYCDFSGYTDIAIGSAQVMGFRLMDNFKRPYFARSISDFWSRWHISLSTWFRDYLYIPMGGNRVVRWRWYYNLLFTFLVSGLWHGANWTFIVWGALHGFYLVFAQITRQPRSRLALTLGLDKRPMLYGVWQVGTTFALVCLAWIFFRANTIGEAWYIVTHLFSGLPQGLAAIIANTGAARARLLYLGQPMPEFYLALLLIAFMEAVHFVQRKRQIRPLLAALPPALRWAVYALYLFVFFFVQSERPP